MKRTSLSKTMLQGIVQTHMVAPAGEIQRVYPESVRQEAARYFRELANELCPLTPFQTVSERRERVKESYGDKEDI